MKSRESRPFLDFAKNCVFVILISAMVILVISTARKDNKTSRAQLLVEAPPDIMAPVTLGYGKKWAFIDVYGNTVISAAFDDVKPFSEGLAAVKIGKEWGYIDKYAKYVITPQYSYAGQFMNGVALVNSNKVIDKTGKPAPGFNGMSITRYENGFFSAMTEGSTNGYRLFDSDLKPLAHIEVSSFESYSDGFFIAERPDRRFAYLNEKGEVLQFETAVSSLKPFQNGYAVVTIPTGYERLIDRTGACVLGDSIPVPLGYHLVGVSEGMVEFYVELDKPVEKSSKKSNSTEKIKRYGFMTLEGEVVIPPKYSDAKPFRDGVAWVCLPESTTQQIGSRTVGFDAYKYFIIDKSGQIVVRRDFIQPRIAYFSSEYMFIEFSSPKGELNAEGLVDMHGDVIIPAIFPNLSSFSHGRAFFRYRNNYVGIMDETGNIIASKIGFSWSPFHDINATNWCDKSCEERWHW